MSDVLPRPVRHSARALGALSSLRLHWPEYLMEAGGLQHTCSLPAFLPLCSSTLRRRFVTSSVTAPFAGRSWDWPWAAQ